MKSIVLGVTLLVAIQVAYATYGIDMSGFDCNAMNQADWDCLVNNGYDFAIIQTWEGGYGYTSHIAQCVSQAWAAKMAHVDVYIFMCPQCSGNGSPEGVVETVVNNLHSQGVNYGMLWFDVEQCDGCWYGDLASNCAYLEAAARQATAMGVHVGVYASEYEWGITVGASCNGLSGYPLWYAHYDGSASFSDFVSFGGWTKPAIKQFNDHGPCVDVDVNWYP